MENVAKALFIVAGVFLGVLLLSVMIYVFRQGASVNQTYDQKQISLQLELYNSQFEEFDRHDNNIMDVISLVNLAFDVNKDVDYDAASSVQIEVAIGGDKFILPNTNQISERNKILNNSSEMPIYNLADLSLKDLTITTVPQKHNLLSGFATKTVAIDLENDKLSTTKLKSGKTVYKYLFAVVSSDDFEYHENNMKVSRIKVTAYCNPEWLD